jgi:phytanoyl-CoA hydroxylase
MGKFSQLSQNADEFLENEAQEQGKWLAAEYEAGDVVFHDPYMIHGSSRNQDERGRIRLSTDLRFCGEGGKMDERWMARGWDPRNGL